MDIDRLPYGQLPDGRRVDLYVLANTCGVTVGVMTYGSAIVSIGAPDRDGMLDDIVLGFDALEGYLSPHPYFGGTIGRYTNRISRGRYTLDGVDYQLACNNGPGCAEPRELSFRRTEARGNLSRDIDLSF
jgi:aldose 1-epimerase